MPRVVASIEARMGSSRLPGKMMVDICGEPAITRLLRRLRLCTLLDDIVLATTVADADDELEKWADSQGVACFRGSEEDVLGRVVGAQRMMSSELVVEVNGDTILLDPEVIDLGVKTYLHNDCDVLSNTSKPSYPDGIDVQVFDLHHLEEVERTVSDPAVREHVSLYFYQHPELYRVLHLQAPTRWHAPQHTLVLDYEEDRRLIAGVYDRLEPIYGDAFGVEEILTLFRREPSLAGMNRHRHERTLQ
jgi:spore coat polysaccharide biosynthesis protein SpsF